MISLHDKNLEWAAQSGLPTEEVGEDGASSLLQSLSGWTSRLYAVSQARKRGGLSGSL